jgi:hypothetical protein
MADDKRSRESQAREADRRQRDRDVRAELDRGDEPEPPIPEAGIAGLESELESVAFPAAATDIVAAAGDHEVQAGEETYAVADLIAETDAETFASPDVVRDRIRRPTVATAMKRILEAETALPNPDIRRSRHEAYERTFRELEAIDAVDEDEGIEVIADWVLDRIEETGALPGSRDVRRQAAKVCRANGYEVRNDEWLGV